jgi:hypothetical protein
MQDEITAAMEGPIDYAHLMSTETFGALITRGIRQFRSSTDRAVHMGSYDRPLGLFEQLAPCF